MSKLSEQKEANIERNMQHRVVKRLAGLTNNLMAQLPQTKVMKIENVEDALEIPYNEDNSS